MSDELVKRLRDRAANDRKIQANNEVVATALMGQRLLFDQGLRSASNTFAVRLGLDYENCAKNDAALAADWDSAADRIEQLTAERDQLREALEQFLNEYDVVDLADAETSSMTAAVFAARGALHVNETPKSEHEAWDMLTPATKGGAL